MTFDDLRSCWQESRPDPVPGDQQSELISHVTRRVERLSSAFAQRDMIETVFACLGIFFFGRAFLRFDQSMAQAGAAIVVISCLFIIFWMHRTRLVRRRSSPDAAVRDYCTVELDRLNRQIRLIQSVAWWYIGPPLLGVNLLYTGLHGWSLASLTYLTGSLLLGWIIYRLHIHGAKKQLIPARDELQQLLDDFSESATLSGT